MTYESKTPEDYIAQLPEDRKEAMIGMQEKQLLDWFSDEYPNYVKRKLDIGKSCIRFKKVDDIPYELIGKLVAKTPVDEWVNIYETRINK